MSRALIADDDPDILELVRIVLAGAGHEVVGVTNGIDAAHRLTVEQFDVAVLDVQMPGMSGLAVLEATRHLGGARPPVVMLSGLTTFQDRARGLEAGATAYVAKPFRISEFLVVVHGVLAGSEAMRG